MASSLLESQSILETYNPPSAWPDLDDIVLTDLAEGYERDNLLRIRDVYLKLRASVQVALQSLTLHRPEWQKRHENAAAEYEDLSRTLNHMNLDCTEQQERLENLTQKAETLRYTLHSPQVQPGETKHTYAGYRRNRLEEAERDKKAVSDRLSELQTKAKVTEGKVSSLAMQTGSAVSVLRYCESGITTLQKIEECLNEEIQGLKHRLGRTIDLLDDKCLSSIFHYTWNMQVEESENQFLSGNVTQISRSPFRTACALASVNKRWRDIMQSEEKRSLWSVWIVEFDPSHIFRLISSVKPNSDVRRIVRERPITLRLLSTPNTVASFFHARVNLKLFLDSQPVNCFQIRCNRESEESTSDLLHAVSTRGHLESLVVVGEAGVQMSKLVFYESDVSRLKYLTLVDIEAEFPSSIAPIQLHSLSLIRNKRLPIGTVIMSTQDISSIISIAPLLETLEVDIGMEDTPWYGLSHHPLGITSLGHLRHLKMRFTLLWNRLSFLVSLEMPALCELTLITMPAQSPQTSWEGMVKFLSSNHKITRLTIMELTEKLKGDCHAGILLDYLPNLCTLILHDNAVSHFLDFLHKRVAEYSPTNSKEPISRLKEIYLRNSSINDEQLLNFIGAYSSNIAFSPNYVMGSSTVSSHRSLSLPLIEMYDCPNISPETFVAIRRERTVNPT